MPLRSLVPLQMTSQSGLKTPQGRANIGIVTTWEIDTFQTAYSNQLLPG